MATVGAATYTEAREAAIRNCDVALAYDPVIVCLPGSNDRYEMEAYPVGHPLPAGSYIAAKYYIRGWQRYPEPYGE